MIDNPRYDDNEPEEGRIDDQADNEDFEVEIEAEIDEDDRPGDGNNRYSFSAEGLFGRDGVFGDNGPFGRNGPFGPDGPFGDNGPFGADFPFGKGRGQRRGRGGRGGSVFVHTGGPRQGRRKRMFGPGELRLVLLALIAGENKHGYELIKEIEELTGGEYSPSPGVIYPTLALLEDEGQIRPVEGDESRKAFRVMDSGMAELEDRSGEVARLMERLGRHARKAQPTGSPDLVRALGNLATVITNRAANGQFSGESKDKVVDLIDELARKIERL